MNKITENLKPKISVVMPAYNTAQYINEAIDSILNQTFTDFEFIIINDGSIDETEKIILSYTDSRIKYYKNESNLGIVQTLNRGFALSQGDYIARMDSDDISVPNRLEIQYNFMKKNQNVGVCGSDVRTFGKKDHLFKYRSNHNHIIVELLFCVPLAHPSVIIDRKIITDFQIKYNEFFRCEDYDLWVQLHNKTILHNISEVLINYRSHYKNITSHPSYYKIVESSILVLEKYLKILNFNYTKDDLIIHQQFFDENFIPSEDFLESCKKWFYKIINENNKNNVFDPNILNETLIHKYYNICCSSLKNINSLKHFKTLEIDKESPYYKKMLSFLTTQHILNKLYLLDLILTLKKIVIKILPIKVIFYIVKILKYRT